MVRTPESESPKCDNCVRLGTDCHHTTPWQGLSSELKRKLDDMRLSHPTYQDLFNLLQVATDQDGLDILRSIKSGTSAEDICNHYQHANLQSQLALVPETRLRFEFPYLSTMPESLLVGDSPYLHSLLYEIAPVYHPPTSVAPSPQLDSASLSSRFQFSNCSARTEEDRSLYLKPFHAARVIEPWLSDVDLSSWTTICNDNMLMRDLLRVFLRCEYQFSAAFRKDLFLEDMATRRDDFCSSLLVNAVLGYACVCYPKFSNCAEYWNPSTLGHRFIAEAKRIWEQEASQARITTIQAGIILTVFHNLCGLDEIGKAYRIQAIALAHKLHLFDASFSHGSKRLQNGRAFTAWALFNWETLTAFSFMLSPLLTKPPDWPLPDPSEDAQWYGEIWLKYPLSDRLSPSNFAHLLRARCLFRIIMNDFCHAAFSKGSRVTLAGAHGFRERLRCWYDELPGPLRPETIVLPGHLQLHIYYQHLMLTIFEPLLDAKDVGELDPKRIVADAKRDLETLVRLYYLRHGFEAMDLFIVIPLMLIGYSYIAAIDSNQVPHRELEASRSTLILVAQGLYSQRHNHYLAEALFRVLRGRMRPREAALLRDTMSFDEAEADLRQDMAQAVKSHWPVAVVRKIDELDEHILTNLVENYAHLNIEEMG
ncbi:uncharacterized protein HMPREF1541_05365 [Cyphellophora europaea CBS 101466]|uniref:Transcription factor domain-containing protein n=1 Tax=Cyphellophora europaea (strain CBS 101466) TaxID=1220924 RepID=W2RRP9_CYPE1|nr:uncharacterized protein HMPREF1541_05365 [Cyphellophora europaea CBS 101466]ETN39142.1 hypothetical protein HMPREF1541_05365 [Cyphellophora europaea CBS 101466]